jgi:hypothetical protein
MKNNTTSSHITHPFVAKHAADVIGVLSGFDRLRLRGTLRALYQPTVLLRYLFVCQVLLKGFKQYALNLTGRILQRAEALANRSHRPWEFLNSGKVSKEERVRQILDQQPLATGLVAVLRCVEPCQTYKLHGLKPYLASGKCMHLYFYHQHPTFGLMHLRLQTWFPFQIEICLNGRQWLARQMDKAHLSYQRQDNYFAWLQDPVKAQHLMNRQWHTSWPAHLKQLLNQDHPLHREICRPLDLQYYWSCAQSEFATDIMFRDPDRLAALFPHLIHHASRTFSSVDVLRFLGHRVPLTGNIDPKFRGEVVTDLKARPEGLRLKHRVPHSSLKMYDKFSRGLRIETTINQPSGFRIFRRPEGAPKQPPSWRRLPRGIAHLHRRAEVSKAANDRYLLALAAVDEKTPLRQLADPVCRPIQHNAHRYRALHPWSAKDAALLAAINRGEFALNGLRNRDLRLLLFPSPANPQEQRRRAARVSRLLALLRAHAILRKVPHTHRYHLSPKGRILVTALLTAREADTQKLTALAA